MLPMQEGPESPGKAASSSSSAKARRGSQDDGEAESGPTAPIGKLSKMALLDAVSEVEATARATWTKSTVAVHKMRQSIDQTLGREVVIKDPALKQLFQENVVAAEDLLGKVRGRAYSFLAATEALSRESLASASGSLRPLAAVLPEGDAKQRDVLTMLEEELDDAHHSGTVQRSHVVSQVQEQVLEVIDARLSLHAKVREDLRERDRWSSVAERTRKDCAKLRKASNKGGSGLRTMLSATQAEESEDLLKIASENVARLDSELLTTLYTLGEEMLESVRKPFAALLQLEAEFYTSQQVTWASVSQA
eukprot:CAMPEP_0178448268 /NCGR_PEP_ID=MMETSP0689_2-20121128/41886_1 /TAXON_ID=160604 /ORGANISM="Amphidinium massartii, Strain CS-259" /LENGTH=306 /DNA_ID=CAMNT_0020073427 /DNA_START=44 /DNA_END=961 /DNA_ORIENTATION=+